MVERANYGSRRPSRAQLLRVVSMHGVPPKGRKGTDNGNIYFGPLLSAVALNSSQLRLDGHERTPPILVLVQRCWRFLFSNRNLVIIKDQRLTFSNFLDFQGKDSIKASVIANLLATFQAQKTAMLGMAAKHPLLDDLKMAVKQNRKHDTRENQRPGKQHRVQKLIDIWLVSKQIPVLRD